MPPVLLLLFNRPDLTRGLVESLRIVRPGELYVAVDGPREGVPDDSEKVEAVRKIAEEEIDWPCRKHWLVRSENLGCGVGVSSAISWFFQQVEQGIILEDDCHPDPSFFTFCESMLQRFANEPSVWSVSGTSLLPDDIAAKESHFFSKFSGVWGWATWRRAWDSYHFDLSICSAAEWREVLEARCANVVELRYWQHILDLMLAGKIDTWDFQVQFIAWKANAVHVTSSRNLVENVGFRPDATHTTLDSPLAHRRAESNHPPYNEVPVLANRALDRIIFAEKLNASPALADWLFGDSTERELRRLLDVSQNALAAKESALQEVHRRSDDLMRENSGLKNEIDALKQELAEYYGVTGAWKCLRDRFS